MAEEKISIKFSREKIQEIMKNLNSAINKWSDKSGDSGDKEIETLKELLMSFQNSLWDKALQKI